MIFCTFNQLESDRANKENRGSKTEDRKAGSVGVCRLNTGSAPEWILLANQIQIPIGVVGTQLPQTRSVKVNLLCIIGWQIAAGDTRRPGVIVLV